MKYKFIFLSIKKNFLPFLFILFAISLVLFSRSNVSAARSGLQLWATAVIPSLFPFFISTELLSYTNLISLLGKGMKKIMMPLFQVPGECFFPFLMGFLSGYPVGAKIVTQFYHSGICSKEQAERLLAFTNNSGPLFIVGTVGITLFGSTQIGILLLVTHILSSISIGILLGVYHRFHKKKNLSFSSTPHISNLAKIDCSFSHLGEILGSSIINATQTILLIGGFVVFFSVVLSILKQSHILTALANLINPLLSIFHINTTFATPILTGILELTNGVQAVTQIMNKEISIRIILCALLLGFGGISVFLQVFSISAKEKLSMKPYFIGKSLQGILAALYTSLLLKLPILNLDLPDIQYVSASLPNSNSILSLLCITSILWFLFYLLTRKVVHKYGKKLRNE